MPAVSLGKRFFANIKKDYSNWHWAVARELYQNGIDCGAKRITIKDMGNGTLMFANDGPPMTRDIIENKLLTMGETTKGDGEIGGFGVAKAIVYFCHDDYKIETGDAIVSGTGGDYEITLNSNYMVDGTVNYINIGNDDDLKKIIRACKQFAIYCQWNGKIVINGDEIETRTRKGYLRREFNFGNVYTNNTHKGLVIVRVGGQPMFMYSHSYDKGVVLELNGSSQNTMTSNRDGLRYPYSGQLQSWLCELAADKHSAMKQDNQITYRLYDGPMSRVRIAPKVKKVTATTTAEVVSGASPVTSGTSEVSVECEQVVVASEARLVASVDSDLDVLCTPVAVHDVELTHEENEDTYEYRVVVKNTTGMVIPEYYLPGTMSKYTTTVLNWYARAVKKCLEILEQNADFSLGLVFDAECEAQVEVNPKYGPVFYINPVKIVDHAGRTRSMEKLYSLDSAGKWRIVANAAHEVVHFAYGLSTHDELFAGKYTECVGRILTRVRQLSKCLNEKQKN